MERSRRLYDCITEISDQYILEAECAQIRQVNFLNIPWKQIGSVAAAFAVMVGVGMAMRQMSAGSADSSAPAMSAPACSAPTADSPEESVGWPDGEVTEDLYLYRDLEELSAAADVIVEGRVASVGRDIELEVSRAMRGHVEVGQILQIRLSHGVPEGICVGDELICFLENTYGSHFRLLHPRQGIAVVKDGLVMLDASLGASADLDAFINKIHSSGR